MITIEIVDYIHGTYTYFCYWKEKNYFYLPHIFVKDSIWYFQCLIEIRLENTVTGKKCIHVIKNTCIIEFCNWSTHIEGVWEKDDAAKRKEVTGGWRQLHIKEFHDLYWSPSIIMMIKSRIKISRIYTIHGHQKCIRNFKCRAWRKQTIQKT